MTGKLQRLRRLADLGKGEGRPEAIHGLIDFAEECLEQVREYVDKKGEQKSYAQPDNRTAAVCIDLVTRIQGLQEKTGETSSRFDGMTQEELVAKGIEQLASMPLGRAELERLLERAKAREREVVVEVVEPARLPGKGE